MSAAQNATSDSPTTTHVLFIAQEPSGLDTVMSYLRRRGWQTSLVTTMHEALVKLSAEKIDAILFSVNLKNVDLKTTYEALSTKHKAPCILFAENASIKTQHTLMSIFATHRSMPPNTGPKIHSRVGSILHEMNQPVTEGKPTPNAPAETFLPNSVTKVTRAHVPPMGRWIRIDEDSRSTPPYTFKLVSREVARSGQNYYFQGATAPMFEESTKLWQAPSADDVYFQDKKVSKKAEVVPVEDETKEPKLIVTPGHPFRPAETIVLNDKNEKSERKKISTGRRNKFKRQPVNALEKCMFRAMETVFSQDIPMVDGEPVKFPTRYAVVLVKTPIAEGYLVTTVSQDPLMEYTSFSELYECLKHKMRDEGQPMEDISPPLTFRIDPLEFLPWAETSSHFVMSSGDEVANSTYVFLKAPITQFIIKSKAGEMEPIPVNTLRDDVPLTFDVYISLPKNDKYLLYFKRDSIVSQSAIDKFDDFKMNKVFLKREDRKSFYAYCAASHLQKERKISGF